MFSNDGFVFCLLSAFLLGALGCPVDVGRDDDDRSSDSDVEELCTNTCAFAGDSECDDCGEGSQYSICDIGTDCDDCGVRTSEDECEDSGGWGDDDDGGGQCNSYTFTCQYCSGSGTCSGNCPSSCYSLCADACASGGCGSVLSCY